jgi:molecular chaperone DnaK
VDLARAVGIDLGTTYSAVAWVDEYGKPVILKNADGQVTTPSVVFVDAPNFVVGETALQSTITDGDRVAQFVKRHIGTPNFRLHIGGAEYSPEFISAIILRKIVQDAQNESGEDIDQAVITVPAYFTEAQRSATIEAGKMAGLQVLRIINEPTAAALSYGITRRNKNRTVLVYDLGGGTFDVTILRVEDNAMNVLSVGGDHHLGGKDWDDRIMAHVEEEIESRYGVEISGDRELQSELRPQSRSRQAPALGPPDGSDYAQSAGQKRRRQHLGQDGPGQGRGDARDLRRHHARPARPHRDAARSGSGQGEPGLGRHRRRAFGRRQLADADGFRDAGAHHGQKSLATRP